MVTDKIFNDFKNLPPTLSSVAKVLYDRTEEQFRDFGKSMLNSFFFLRFIIPAFSVTGMVGLTSIDEKSKQTLTLLSRAIMTPVLSNVYTNYANLKYDELRSPAASQKLNEKPLINQVDQAKTMKDFHVEAFQLLSTLTSVHASLDDDDRYKKYLSKILQNLRQLGYPKLPADDEKRLEAGKKNGSENADVMDMHFHEGHFLAFVSHLQSRPGFRRKRVNIRRRHARACQLIIR